METDKNMNDYRPAKDSEFLPADDLACNYAGQIGYWIDESHQKQGYATNSCIALLPLIKAHGYNKIVVGTDENNFASHRVCEKVGMNLLETVDTPEWSVLHEEGQRRTKVYVWDVKNTNI